MSDKSRPHTDQAVDQSEHDGWSMRTKLILAGIGIIAFIGLYLLAVYWVPGEWARFITGITNRSTSTSWLLGLAIGFSFSLLPILVFLMGMRMRKSWRGIIGWFLVALVVALPNILTLGVRFGSRAAANAARTTMFTDAPGFTIASYVGMAIGIATGLWVAWITISRRRAQRKAAQLAAKTREHDEPSGESTQPAQTAGSTPESATDAGSSYGSSDAGSQDGSQDGSTNEGSSEADAAGDGGDPAEPVADDHDAEHDDTGHDDIGHDDAGHDDA